MPDELADNVHILRNAAIFGELSIEQLKQIAPKFHKISLEPGQHLFSGREPEEDLYIIQSGRVLIKDGSEEVKHRSPGPGDFFAEESLLYGQPDQAYLTTDEPTQLLHLEADEFYHLIGEFPQIKAWFARNPESQWFVKNRNFEWVGDDEVIAHVARKHIAIFIFSLIGPVIFFLIALTIIIAVTPLDSSSTIWTTGVVCSSILAFFATLWGFWNWIDWGNDYYIVTNQRVVWEEKVIWLYESRDEAPLTTILAVNATTTFMGRLLNYGSVVVRTFTGEITFRNLKDSRLMVEIIEEYRDRVRRGSERKQKQEIERAIRQRLGIEREEELEESAAASVEEGQEEKISGLRSYFRNFFTMRFEEGNVITYRKYWPTLFGKIWTPTGLIFLVVIGMVFLINAFWSGVISAQSIEIILGLSFVLIILVLMPWWIYKYVDWRNDIYQVTDKNIVDIERRPLGTEVKKSAPLENILSLEHERVGFIGYMLNYGFVTINVGETQFVFRNVHDPAKIQQDIFNRIHALRRHKEKIEAAQQRQRFVDVIDVYHHNVEEIEPDEYYDEFDDDYDYGVELGSDGYT